MLFSSIVFLFYFFPSILIIYYALNTHRLAQNIFLFVASMIFYAWVGIKFLLLLLCSIIINYLLGLLIEYIKKTRIKKLTLIIGITVNILYLGYFKYTYFILNSIDGSGWLAAQIPGIILPVGISFYTFQAISYLIDIYRKDCPAQKNPLYTGLCIALFTNVTSGPIMRYTQIEKQLTFRPESLRMFSAGLCRFCKGLAKKLLLANNMGIVADHIFQMNQAGTIPMTLALLGSISYTLQILFDFASYSDMAIGLGYMFGFKIPENFNYPYIAKTVTEFWRRWHITLGDWFKTYVYFPLGGSRVNSTDTLVRNLLIVWVLTGIWHGANWTFILWGLLNFVCITVEKLFNLTQMSTRRGNFFLHVYMTIEILCSWTLFRAESLTLAGRYFSSLCGSGGFYSSYALMFLREFGIYYLLCFIFLLPISRRFNSIFIANIFPKQQSWYMISYPLIMIGLFLISLIFIIKGTYSPFIYFKF